jgi:CRP-like cAMP-binding protein
MNIGRLFNFFRDDAYRSKREFLMRLPIFHGLRQKDFVHLVQALDDRTYLKGETLFNEGDVGRALFIVDSGDVQLLRKDDSGKDNPLAEVRPGEIFGEMALLEEMPRTAGAQALEKTKVYLLYKNKLERLIYEHPRIGVVIVHYLARTLSSRLRALMESRHAAAEQVSQPEP